MVDVYEVDLFSRDVERDNRYGTVATKLRYSEGGSTARLIRLSRRDRRVVAESTTIISVWADTIDMVIKIKSLQHLHCQLLSPVNAVTSRRSGSDMKIPTVGMGTPSILKHVRMPE